MRRQKEMREILEEKACTQHVYTAYIIRRSVAVAEMRRGTTFSKYNKMLFRQLKMTRQFDSVRGLALGMCADIKSGVIMG